MLTNDLIDFIYAAKNLHESHNVTLDALKRILEINLEAQ